MAGVTKSAWPLKRLKDITSKIGSGATPRGGKNGYRAEGISLIRSLNVYDFSFTEEDLAFISDEQAAELDNVIVQKNDILLNITGASVARCCLTNSKFLPARVNQHVAIVRIRPDVADARFVLYCINSVYFKSRLLALAQGGATREALTKITIEDFEVFQPPLSVQRRIAGILSAYDELIENSQRRIRILEMMARTLYHEWFVHFRFPGHEKLPRVASPLGEIPKGWEVKRLNEVCKSIQDGDWIETKDQGGEDYRLLQISNIGIGEFIETGNFRYVSQETFDRLHCNEIVPGDLLVARMPTPIGRGWLATRMPWKMITAVDVAIIRADPNVVHPLFLVLAWNESSNLQRIAGQASGTTRLRITRRELAALEFVVPQVAVQQRFASIIEPQATMIQTLRQQIQNLRSTRDLLLPRLLSGQAGPKES